MCVIVAVNTGSERPSRSDLKLMQDENPHGAGIAWIERGFVRFEKDVKADRIVDLAMKVPTPFVLHFRWRSSGKICGELCHPFPLRLENPLALKGKTKRGVVFHNGTWTDWRANTLAAACATGKPIGDGPMSDTRALAYLATVLGKGVLETMPPGQRIALVTPAGIVRFGPWTELADGVHVSNTRWLEESKPAAKHQGGFLYPKDYTLVPAGANDRAQGGAKGRK